MQFRLNLYSEKMTSSKQVEYFEKHFSPKCCQINLRKAIKLQQDLNKPNQLAGKRLSVRGLLETPRLGGVKLTIQAHFEKLVDLQFFENSQKSVCSRVRYGAVLRFESLLLCILHHLACEINSESTEVQSNIVSKIDNNITKIKSVTLLQYLC